MWHVHIESGNASTRWRRPGRKGEGPPFGPHSTIARTRLDRDSQGLATDMVRRALRFPLCVAFMRCRRRACTLSPAFYCDACVCGGRCPGLPLHRFRIGVGGLWVGGLGRWRCGFPSWVLRPRTLANGTLWLRVPFAPGISPHASSVAAAAARSRGAGQPQGRVVRGPGGNWFLDACWALRRLAPPLPRAPWHAPSAPLRVFQEPPGGGPASPQAPYSRGGFGHVRAAAEAAHVPRWRLRAR
jgi:hypothetical protein